MNDAHRVAAGLNRRHVLAMFPWLLPGIRAAAAQAAASQAPKGPDLREELTAAEAEIVRKSAMARDLQNFFGNKYSCAESGLAVGLRHLKKPDDLVWLACGFGGGLYQQDLCGFLTAGVMVLGIHAGTLSLERAAARRACIGRVREFWQWWTSEAPIHCREIREGHADLKVCSRLGQLACARLESLMTG